MGGKRLIACAAAAACVLAAAGAPASAQEDQQFGTDYGGFRNVLPGGQGETVNAQELAAFQAAGDRPRSFITSSRSTPTCSTRRPR